ncbi:atlastin-3-like isoform X1 [Haemaphysalis longicornis]
MASQRNTGRPVQIVRLEGGKGCSLDKDALARILLADDVKDLPVMVLSVAGVFRKGKSFLLNFFVRYMLNRNKADWLVDDNVPLQGFKWSGGSATATKGIWIWDEVFVVTTTGGKKVAVIFLDTQGTFDTKSTVNNCVTIFALSMVASSVQIYNISQNIGEDHLQHLQLFTQFGKMALESQFMEEKPLQKILFLVRDWQYGYESAYGFEGGKDLLEQCLAVSEEQHPELQSIRRDIRSCFSDISCFLMPHPGAKVASDRCFAGCLSDIDQGFKEQLRGLVSAILQPDRLVVKKIGDSDMTCRQLLDYLETFANIFNEGKLPDAKSMFEAAAEAQNSMAVRTAFDHYRIGMEKVFHGEQPFLDGQCLEGYHFRWRELALRQFVETPKLGGDARSKLHKGKLEQMIDREFESIYNRNERMKAEANKMEEEAHKKAEAEFQKQLAVQAFIDLVATAAPLFANAACEPSSEVPKVVARICELLKLGNVLYANSETIELIAKMIAQRGIHREDLQKWVDQLETWIAKMEKSTGMEPTGASGTFSFFAGGMSIEMATTLRNILLGVMEWLGEETDGSKKN